MENDQSPIIPQDASFYYYVGRVLPKGSDVPLRNLDLNDFTPDQTKKLNLAGLRHCRQHDDKKEIGRILEDPSYDNEKFAIGRIDVNDPIGKLTVMEILDGKTSDLSLTHNYGLMTYPGMYVEIKEPTEISSVEKGNRPDCRILWGSFDNEFEKQPKRKEKNTMTTPMDTSAPIPQPNPPAPSAVQQNPPAPSSSLPQPTNPVTQPPQPTNPSSSPPQPTNPATQTPQPTDPTTQTPSPEEQSEMFSPENLQGLTESQKTELLIEFSKNNESMKREMTNLASHKKDLEDEKARQFEEQKTSFLDLIKNAGGQVESLESELNTFSPQGKSFDEQNRLRGTLVAVKNSVEEFAALNKNLREENERLKAQSLMGKTTADAQDRFSLMMSQMRNSAPNPARFEQTSQQENTSELSEPKKRKMEEESSSAPEPDQDVRMFNNMRDVLTKGTGHISGGWIPKP